MARHRSPDTATKTKVRSISDRIGWLVLRFVLIWILAILVGALTTGRRDYWVAFFVILTVISIIAAAWQQRKKKDDDSS
jgi:MFS-type transporter involved in bile tolerance (Atg22 family)